jgi:hypothetical protein
MDTNIQQRYKQSYYIYIIMYTVFHIILTVMLIYELYSTKYIYDNSRLVFIALLYGLQQSLDLMAKAKIYKFKKDLLVLTNELNIDTANKSEIESFILKYVV